MAEEDASAPLGLTEAYSVKTPDDNQAMYSNRVIMPASA